MSLSLVSILIPNFDKAPFIRETLDSIISQSYTNWECIIIDDASTDKSWEILEEYSEMDNRIQIFKRPSNLQKGGNICRNYALTVSNGEYILWFDSDDIMIDSLILDRLTLFKRDPKLDFVVSSGMKFFDSVGDTSIIFSHLFYKGFEIESFISIDPPWLTPSCLFKREFLIQNNIYWNESLTILQDVHYNLTAFLNTNSIGYINDKIDWCWRWHLSGRNTGAQRGKIENLPSLNLLIELFSNICNNYSDKYAHLRVGYFELIKSTHKIFGLRWYNEFYCNSIGNVGLSTFKKRILIIVVYSLILLKTEVPSMNRVAVRLILFFNRVILLNKKYIKLFNTKSILDFNDATIS